MKLEKIVDKIIQECDYETDNAKITFQDGTILEFEMNCEANPAILDVYLTKPRKERKLY
jgi:hypothetical protein